MAEERKRFEAWVSGGCYGRSIARYPRIDDGAWPGQYRDLAVQLAWEAWCGARGIKEGING